MYNNDLENSIIVACPVQQHSFQLSKALNDSGMLHTYCTTVYYKSNLILYKVLDFLLPAKFQEKLHRKKNETFDSRTLCFSKLIGLAFFTSTYMKHMEKLSSWIYRLMTKLFGCSVARYAINKQVKAVVMYDFTAPECFNVLSKKSEDIIRILDMSSIPAYKIREIVEREQSKSNAFSDSYKKTAQRYSKKNCSHYQSEITLADYFLVASVYVKKILIDYGVPKEKIYLVPLGVDINQFKSIQKDRHITKKKLNFLFVGRVEGPKGVNYLLEAFDMLWKENQEFRLIIVGNDCSNGHLLDPYKEFCDYRGQVSHSEMAEIYKTSDVFVLPSLWEGFSLSLFEAMSSGLPSIVTEFAEGIIEDEKTGFVIPTESVSSIYEKALWFLNNREKIAVMGENSINLAKKFTWRAYEEKVVTAIKDILNEKRIRNR